MNPCYQLIVSMMLHGFKRDWFAATCYINLWDLSNPVIPEVREMYKLFLPALLENRDEDLAGIFASVKERFFDPIRNKDGFFLWFSSYSANSGWYDAVREGRLDVIWFEPELFLNALINFEPAGKTVKTQINSFLDILIRTYAQGDSELLKRFRVNIFFNKFLQQLAPQDKESMIVALQSCSLDESRKNFLPNCTQYIANRLDYMYREKYGKILSSSVEVTRKDPESTTPLESFKNPGFLIDSYKRALRNIGMQTDSSIWKYLTKLAKPILSLDDLEAARSSQPFMGYLGAPT